MIVCRYTINIPCFPLLFGSPRVKGSFVGFTFLLYAFFGQVKKAYGFLRPDDRFEA